MQLVSGAVGGIGDQLLGMLGIATGAGEMDIDGIVGLGGGALMAIIGAIRKAIAK